MGVPIINNAIAEINVGVIVDGQQCMSLFHYRLTNLSDPPGSIDSDAATATLWGLFDGPDGVTSVFDGARSSDTTRNYVTVQWIYPTRLARIFVMEGSVAGTGPATVYPPGVAGAITKRGVFAGRHNRGVLHMPGVPAMWGTAGVMNAAGLTAYAALATRLTAVLTPGDFGDTYEPVIYNRSAPNTSAPIISVTTGTSLRTARRRVVGRGI